MSIYLLIDIVIITLYLLLAYFTITGKNAKTKQGRIFLALVAMLLVWTITNHVSNDAVQSYEIALIATRILFPASFLSAVLAYGLIKDIAKEKSFLFKPVGAMSVLFSAILFASPFTVDNIYLDGSVYGVKLGILGPVYALLLAWILLAMLVVVIRNWNSRNFNTRKQIRAVGFGAIVSVSLIFLIAFIIPNATGSFEISKIAIAPTIIILATIYYSVIRHGLFDLRAVAIRTMTYVLTLSILTAVYFLSVYFLSVIILHEKSTSTGLSTSPINVVLALLMAIIFQPIKNSFDKLTNNIFYRGKYNQEVFLKEFSDILSYNTKINVLISRTGDYISDNLKATAATFYIKDRDLFRSRGSSPIRLSNNTLSELCEGLSDIKESLILTDQVDSERMNKILRHNKIEITIPMRLNDQTIGYLFLGEQKNGAYEMRDVHILESITNELVIAIQNSLSVEVIRDLNENLQQKVEEATSELRRSNEKLKELDKTKDEFLSIASHQLRTPLTSIKGYIDMLREGDFGPVNEAQKVALDETFSSSERMVRLIGDFLNVSRLQTGKFTIDKRPTDLTELLMQEISMLESLAKQSEIKLEVDTDDIRGVNLDAEKLRQVILNMIDNAIYYSKPNSTIKISLKKDGNSVRFTVKDTGIGVPKEDQKKLFSKFFRAPNAQTRRPDGTGVGLFLSNKVISGHDGKIIFKSEEDKGSTFGFLIPT